MEEGVFKRKSFLNLIYRTPKGAEGEWTEGNLSFGRQK